jgi:hypothetical protein
MEFILTAVFYLMPISFPVILASLILPSNWQTIVKKHISNLHSTSVKVSFMDHYSSHCSGNFIR